MPMYIFYMQETYFKKNFDFRNVVNFLDYHYAEALTKITFLQQVFILRKVIINNSNN